MWAQLAITSATVVVTAIERLRHSPANVRQYSKQLREVSPVVKFGIVCFISLLFSAGISNAENKNNWAQNLESCEIVHQKPNFLGSIKDYRFIEVDLGSLTGAIAMSKVRLECGSGLKLSAQYFEASTGSAISPSDLLKKLNNGQFDPPMAVSDFLFFRSDGSQYFDAKRGRGMVGYLCVELRSDFFAADLNAASRCGPTERTLIVDSLPFAPPNSTACKLRVMFKSKQHLVQVISNPVPQKCANLDGPIILSEVENLITFIKYLDVHNVE
jgi:hypothetical protein